MKVICDRSALLDAINTVSGVVAVRTPRQQLTCVRLDAEREGDIGVLTLSGTDAEISLRLRLDRVTVEEPGSVLVPADKLRQIVSAEDADATLTLQGEGEACEILGADARFKILGYPPEEFPAIPDYASAASGAKATFEHAAGSLDALVARTIFAKARDNSRYAINGVLLRREGKKLELVATDGRRLALARSGLSGGEKDAPTISCIIPPKALLTLQRLVEDPDEPVQIAVSDNQIFFNLGGEHSRATLASNLVEGTFPPYEDVIPKDQDKQVLIDRDVLASAVRRAALLTSEETRGVRLKFEPGEKQLTLESRAPEMGEASVTIDLAEYKGEPIEIGFNPTFITDALKVIDQTEVTLELKAPNKPGLMRSGSDFLYVVMPVNLS